MCSYTSRDSTYADCKTFIRTSRFSFVLVDDDDTRLRPIASFAMHREAKQENSVDMPCSAREQKPLRRDSQSIILCNDRSLEDSHLITFVLCRFDRILPCVRAHTHTHEGWVKCVYMGGGGTSSSIVHHLVSNLDVCDCRRVCTRRSARISENGVCERN